MDQATFLRDLDYRPHERPSAAELRKRWLELCKKHHPDAGGDPELFRKVTHAYQMLTDPEYRHAETLRELRQRPNGKGDLNMKIQVPITFDDAFFGRTVAISYNRLEVAEDGTPVVQEKQDVVYERIKVPAGSVQGYEHIIPEGGHRSGETRGMAYVVLVPCPHKKFRVEGADVVADEEVPLSLLLKGGKLEVQTMYGVQIAKIPAGTPPGSRIALPRCGLMRQGRHIIVVNQRFPSKEELRSGQEWKGLEVDWAGEEDVAWRDPQADKYLEFFRRMGV